MFEIVSNLLDTIPVTAAAAGLALTIIVFYILESSRWILLPLLMQYALLGIILGKSVYVLLAPIWLIIGLCVTGLFASSGALSQPSRQTGSNPNKGMGTVFDVLVLSLAAMITLGVHTALPAEGMQPSTALALYWLITGGVFLLLQRKRALFALGAVSMLNGAMGLYLHVETSLLVVALSGFLTILVGFVAATLPQRAAGEEK